MSVHPLLRDAVIFMAGVLFDAFVFRRAWRSPISGIAKREQIFAYHRRDLREGRADD